KLGEAGASATTDTASTMLTMLGTPVGTAAYMSPEQARGEDLDGRSDLFSLGSVLYELAGGKPAFPGSNFGAILSSILTAEPMPITQVRSDVPVELEKIINRALVKDREGRYQTAGELKEDLIRLRDNLASDSAKASSPVPKTRAQS